MNELGRYLRQLRNELGVSINELVKRSNVSKGYISQIENGFIPTRKILSKIASGLTLDNKEDFGKIYKELLGKSGYKTDWFYLDEVDESVKARRETVSLIDQRKDHQDPQTAQYKDDENKLFETVVLAYRHQQPLPIIVDKDNKVNIKVCRESGLTLDEKDTRELTAMINGFLYGKKFVSKEDEENTAFEDACNDEDKNY